ncbi:MAG: thymidylate kinase [Oscillospiraceae bacterium]
MCGKLIVIEGLDGSGKATQTNKLKETLTAEGKSVEALSFPCYDSDSSALVRMYLSGQLGQRPEDVNCYAASTFYAADRYASYRAVWGQRYLAGGMFVADRYTTSNAVHQMCKLERARWDEYLDWLFDFEYSKLGIPKPDAVIYLDMQPETSDRLMQKRYSGDESKKDIHEKDIHFQQISREAANYCAKKYSWTIIPCDEGGELRTVDSIAGDVLASIKETL